MMDKKDLGMGSNINEVNAKASCGGSSADFPRPITSSSNWKWLEDIEEALIDWCEEKRDSYPPNGPKGTTYFKKQTQLLSCIKTLRSALIAAHDRAQYVPDPFRGAITISIRATLVNCAEGKFNE